MTVVRLVVALLACVALSVPAGLAHAQTTSGAASKAPEPAAKFKESLTVVGITPLPGIGVPLDRVPSNVQASTSTLMARTPGIHLGAQLGNALASVHLNEAQSSTFQPDVQFRGFAASPLLGLPQGLAVYQDGVRLNEPFGDTVNWDLLPSNAIAGVVMMPGSNPLFGLNALGGALSLQTKSGFSNAGHAARYSGGSFGRQWAELESGGSRGSLGYFIAGRWVHEEGWRRFSPSRVAQLFGSVERQTAAGRVAVSVTASTNRLIGNGPLPVQLLELDRREVFTHQDITSTTVGLVTATARRRLGTGVELQSVGYVRPAGVSTFNGDDTAYGACEASAFGDLLCEDEGGGDVVLDRDGRALTTSGRLLNATNNRSRTSTRGWGASGQLTSTRRVGGRESHFVAGAAVDGAASRYRAETELARLTESRGTVGAGLFDAEADVRLRTSVAHVGVFAGEFFSLTPRLTLSASTRVTRSAVRLEDQLGDELNGDHRFSGVNAAGGATFALAPPLTLFGGYSRSTRVPTPSELSCADPDDPCRLPNAFLADPPLAQVVARTWETGARGRAGELSWNAAVFTTRNTDDIIFISSGPLTNHGHFANVGTTSRAGLEFTASGPAPFRIAWRGAYTYLRATFASPLVLGSANHPDAVNDELAVQAGSRLPNVPRHQLKGELVVPIRRLDLAASLSRFSSQFLRGDEANLLAPIDAATTVNLVASYRVSRNVSLLARATNLFDTKPSSFGLLGEADDVLGDAFDDPRFLSPGAPRALWVGAQVQR
jgi:iron complex outermembrane receptor protein